MYRFNQPRRRYTHDMEIDVYYNMYAPGGLGFPQRHIASVESAAIILY